MSTSFPLCCFLIMEHVAKRLVDPAPTLLQACKPSLYKVVEQRDLRRHWDVDFLDS